MRQFYGLYVGENRMMVLPQYGGKLFTYANDLSLTPALLIDGIFEVGLTNYMFQNIKEGMTVIDVGANLGYFSVLIGYLVGAQGKVYAYEANPEMHRLLVDNLTVNELKHNAVAINQAVSWSEGTLNFNVSKRFKGNSSLIAHSGQYKADFKSDEFEVIAVKATALDNAHLGEKVDFIKIDVEGAELEVFTGMGEIIAAHKPQIVFEFNKSMMGEAVEAFRNNLESHRTQYGYRFYYLDAQGSLLETSLDDIFSQTFVDNILMKA